MSFGRNEDNKAADYAALAQERQGFEPTQKLKVEPMTLKALVRERIEAGKEMPTELFNVFVGNKTTIKRKQINMNQVTTKKEGALAVELFLKLMLIKGAQNISQDDLALPFLKVLGQLSPEVNKTHGKYVKDAEPGKIINTVTNELYDVN